jgi:hypothetical protein
VRHGREIRFNAVMAFWFLASDRRRKREGRTGGVIPEWHHTPPDRLTATLGCGGHCPPRPVRRGAVTHETGQDRVSPDQIYQPRVSPARVNPDRIDGPRWTGRRSGWGFGIGDACVHFVLRYPGIILLIGYPLQKKTAPTFMSGKPSKTLTRSHIKAGRGHLSCSSRSGIPLVALPGRSGADRAIWSSTRLTKARATESSPNMTEAEKLGAVRTFDDALDRMDRVRASLG